MDERERGSKRGTEREREKISDRVKRVFSWVERTFLSKGMVSFFFFSLRRQNKSRQLNLYIHIRSMQRSQREKKKE
jgi:hypothetical protein